MILIRKSYALGSSLLYSIFIDISVISGAFKEKRKTERMEKKISTMICSL